MYKKCKSNESVERQNAIANCFSEMLKEYSYDDITITELCRKTNIPRNTFYRYFDGKDSILQYLIEKCYIELLELMMHMHEEKTSTLINYFAEWLRHYREYDHLWSLTYYNEKHGMLFSEMINYYTKLKNSNFKQDFNNLQTKQIIFLSYGTQGILDVWKYTGYTQNEEEVAKQFIQLLKTPMLSLQPTGKEAKTFLSKRKEESYFIEQLYTNK